MCRFQISDTVGTSISCGSADEMVLNPTFDVLSVINRGGCKSPGENHTLIHLKLFKHCLYGGRKLQGASYMTEIIYSPIISALVDEKELQIVPNFVSVLFNTKLK